MAIRWGFCLVRLLFFVRTFFLFKKKRKKKEKKSGGWLKKVKFYIIKIF